MTLELYGGAFDELAAVASYGRCARAIINAAIDDLEPEVSDTPASNGGRRSS